MENILTMSNKKYYVNRTGKNNSEDRDVYVDHEQDEYVFNQGELRAPTATNNRHHPTHDREHRNEANVPKDRTNGISHGQHNIYLYQIPKRNKCTVKKSMDGVYDIANREDLDSADGKGKPKGCSNATNKYCWLLITALVFLVNTGAVLFAVIFITTPVQLAVDNKTTTAITGNVSTTTVSSLLPSSCRDAREWCKPNAVNCSQPHVRKMCKRTCNDCRK